MPCVGVSFGVDRIFTILNAGQEKKASRREMDVYVMASGGGGGGADGDEPDGGLLLERMAVTRQLWDAGIRAEFAPMVKVKLGQQFRAAKGVPIAVVIRGVEFAEGMVRVNVLGRVRVMMARVTRGIWGGLFLGMGWSRR